MKAHIGMQNHPVTSCTISYRYTVTLASYRGEIGTKGEAQLACKVCQDLPARGTAESTGLSGAVLGQFPALHLQHPDPPQLLAPILQVDRLAAATAAAAHSAADATNDPAATAAAARAGAEACSDWLCRLWDS